MIKINISQDTKNNFYNQVMDNFKDKKRLEKRKNKKLILDKSLLQINNLIRKKLSKFDNNISLEKLIRYEYKDIKNLIYYIKNNPIYTKLTIKEKDIFLTLYSRLNNSDYINDLDIKACPYCNRNYIFNFKKAKSLEATAQLDHFFDKKTYPYLSVSLYNLIPSCSTCNLRKSSKEENIFYPYKDDFNTSVKFDFDLRVNDSDDILNKSTDFYSSDKIKIKYNIIKNEEKVKQHIEVFNIENLYNEHTDIVSELLQKELIYSDGYIDELYENFENIFENKEDLERLITCGYMNDEDINKRPLSKLIKDISEELGLTHSRDYKGKK